MTKGCGSPPSKCWRTAKRYARLSQGESGFLHAPQHLAILFVTGVTTKLPPQILHNALDFIHRILQAKTPFYCVIVAHRTFQARLQGIRLDSSALYKEILSLHYYDI